MSAIKKIILVVIVVLILLGIWYMWNKNKQCKKILSYDTNNSTNTNITNDNNVASMSNNVVNDVQNAATSIINEIESWYNNMKSGNSNEVTQRVYGTNQKIDSVNRNLQSINMLQMPPQQSQQINSILQSANKYITNRNSSNSSVPQIARFSGLYDNADPDVNCSDYALSTGGYCTQDTPSGSVCFRSGNDSQKQEGWYSAVEMEKCMGRPACNDVMKKCNGYTTGN